MRIKILLATFGNNTTLGAWATEVKAAQIVFIKVFNKMLLIIYSVMTLCV